MHCRFTLNPFLDDLVGLYLYILAILGLFYVGFRYFIKWTQMKNTISMQKEQERQKEEMMQMKMRFFTDVSHEFGPR